MSTALQKKKVKSTFKCELCKKGFHRESSLLNHPCEPARRLKQKNEAGVRIGFYAWKQTYQIIQGSAKLKTYEDFCSSSLYTDFVKFGNYLESIRAISPESYVDYLVKSKIKINTWCNDSTYLTYLVKHLRREKIEDAIYRSITEISNWEEETGIEYNQFFNKASTNRIIQMISNGRISPWMLYNCVSGSKWLSSLSDQQLTLIYDFINPEIWESKISRNSNEISWIEYILTEAGFNNDE